MRIYTSNAVIQAIPNWLTTADAYVAREPVLLGRKRWRMSQSARQKIRYGVFTTLSLSSVGVVPGLLVLAWLMG